MGEKGDAEKTGVLSSEGPPASKPLTPKDFVLKSPYLSQVYVVFLDEERKYLNREFTCETEL